MTDLPRHSTARAAYLRRHVDATPERVFAAWTDPAVMGQWLFAGPLSEIVQVRSNLRVGGRFSVLERPHDGSADTDHFGEYLHITRPHHVAFTLEVPAHFPGRTHVTVEIAPDDAGSLLALTQTGVDPSAVQSACLRIFDQFGQALLNRTVRHSREWTARTPATFQLARSPMQLDAFDLIAAQLECPPPGAGSCHGGAGTTQQSAWVPSSPTMWWPIRGT